MPTFIEISLPVPEEKIFEGFYHMNLNATKCTFGHSDITRRKQQEAKK